MSYKLNCSKSILKDILDENFKQLKNLKCVVTETDPTKAEFITQVKRHSLKSQTIESICIHKPFYFNLGKVIFKAGRKTREPFRYMVVYNRFSGRIVCWFDYGFNCTLCAKETFSFCTEGHKDSLLTFSFLGENL